MANFTKTVSNAVNTFGGRTNKWNEFNWNAFKWGEGTADLPVDVMHMIFESVTPDSAIPNKDSEFILSVSLALDTDMTDEVLTDGSGYNYIFPSNTQNHENIAIPSYTSGSNNGTIWSSGSAGSITWS